MSVSLNLEVPIFNFDIIQGQDLTIPIRYQVTGITDTMVGATLKMEIRTPEFARIVDTLSSVNGRIVTTGINTFELRFPNIITTAYKITVPSLELIYGLEITVGIIIKRLFEGTVYIKREQTK